jgi:hypothetical protein
MGKEFEPGCSGNLDPALSSHLVKDHIPSTSPFSVSLHKISHTLAPILWTDWYLVQIHYPGKEPVAPQPKKVLLGSLSRIHKLQRFWASIWLLKNKETSSSSHNGSDKQNLGTMYHELSNFEWIWSKPQLRESAKSSSQICIPSLSVEPTNFPERKQMQGKWNHRTELWAYKRLDFNAFLHDINHRIPTPWSSYAEWPSHISLNFST